MLRPLRCAQETVISASQVMLGLVATMPLADDLHVDDAEADVEAPRHYWR